MKKSAKINSENKLQVNMLTELRRFQKKLIDTTSKAKKSISVVAGTYIELGKWLDENGFAHFVTVPQSPKSKFDTWYKTYKGTLKSEMDAQQVWENVRALGDALKDVHQKLVDAKSIQQEYSRWLISIKRNQVYYSGEQKNAAAVERAKSDTHKSNCRKINNVTPTKKDSSIDTQFKNKRRAVASRLKDLQKVILEIQELSVDEAITEPQAKLVEPMAQAMEDIIPKFAAVGIEANTIWDEEEE